MKSAWDALPTRDDDGCVLAVVEATSESRSKFKYEPAFQEHRVPQNGDDARQESVEHQ